MNQYEASESGEKGTLSFEVYPLKIESRVIFISGVIDGKSGPVVMAIVKKGDTGFRTCLTSFQTEKELIKWGKMQRRKRNARLSK